MPLAPPSHTSQPPLVPRAWASSPARVRRFTFLPLLLVAFLYLGVSFGPAVFDQNEAQYAAAVREMLDRRQDYLPATRGQLERGHWYIPTNDGVPRLQKPPLVYWLLMVSMRIFGVNEFGARLPNAAFTLLWFWATFLLGRRIGGEAFAIVGTTILATMAGTFIFSHLIAPEPFLAAFLTLTYWCFLAACQEPRRAERWLFFAWILMGLGVCTKGLHAVLYPLAVAGLLAWRHPESRRVWKKLVQPAGLVAFLIIVVPWYAIIAARYPGFLHDQFINEQLGHAINRRYPPDSDHVPFLVFWLEHLIFFVPWTFLIPAALAARRQGVAGRDANSLEIDLLICWFGVTAVSLVFSSLQDYYLMTAWAPIAFWLARPWATPDADRTLPRWVRIVPGGSLVVIGVALLAAAVYLALHGFGAGAGRAAAPTEARDTIAGTLAGFSMAAWRQMLPLVWAAGGIFLAGGAVSIYLALSGRWRGVLTATAVMMVGVLLVAWCGLNVLEDYFTLKGVALTANRLAGPAGEVVCAGLPLDNPSLLFYLNREAYWVDADPAVEFASRELGIGRDLYLSEDQLARLWKSPRTILLITEADDVAQWRGKLGLDPAQMQPVAQSGTRVLLANHVGHR